MSGIPRSLFEGYVAFKYGKLRSERARYRELAARGQKPEVMLIGCCDSRAAPETIFDASPGELFVVRNVANLVPPYEPDGEYHSTSAALEFGVQALKVKHIVVMGHARCGGIAAALACAFPAIWRLRGRSRHNKAVNFEGAAEAGRFVEVEISAATSQTLSGTERLLSGIGA